MMQRYNGYLIALVAGFVGPALLWAALVFFQFGAPTETSRWAAEIYARKIARAESIAGPKLIVAAGSSALFNIRTEQIEQETGVPTVNLGTHAGLGLDYLLWRLKQVAKPNDIILLPLEYYLYQDSRRPGEDLIDHVFARDRAYFDALPLTERIRFVYAMSPARLLTGLRARFDPPAPQPGFYEASTLNAYGDETTNLESNRVEGVFARDIVEPLSVFLTGIPETSSAWPELADLIAWTKERDITLWASFPATLAFPEYQQPVAQEVLQQIVAFYASQGVLVLGSPEEFMYDISLMFDTRYHLTQKGMTINTEKIVGLLEPELQRFTKVELP